MKISIITATWNSASTIQDTLKSVLSQDFTNYEHIIIDGDSSDDTLKILQQYAPKYNGRLKVVSERDNGIYDAMNKGINLATGEIVGILNSDDFYSSPFILQQVVEAIQDVDAVYGDVHYVDQIDTTKTVRSYSSRSFRRWKMKLGFMPAHPSFYCRRSVYQTYGFFDLSFHVAADFEQLLRLIYIHNITTKYLPLDFVTMRTGGASSSGFSSHKQIIRDHLRAYKKNNVSSNIFFESLRYLHRIGEMIKFRMQI